MKPFTIGAIAGMSSLALAVPLLAQVAGAASSDTLSSASARFMRTVPSQECVVALADREEAMLGNFDEMTAAHKTALLAKHDALEAAALITDDTQRQEALHKAEEDFRAAMKAAHENADMDAIMESVRAACGNAFGGHGPKMGMGEGHGSAALTAGSMKGPRGPMLDRLSEKLGMTEEELQAALDAGKTIPEIAEEQGVELPEHSGRGKGKMFGRFAGPASENDDQ